MEILEFVKNSSPETLRAYRSDLAQLIFLEDSVESITETELQLKFKDGLRTIAHLEPSSRARKVATLKGFSKWLFETGAITRDLSILLRTPKTPQKLPRFLSLDEVVSVLKQTQQDLEIAKTDEDRTSASITRVLVLLLYGGGLRVSEACGLQWKQVDLARSQVRITREGGSKGGKERIVTLPETVSAILMKWERKENSVLGIKSREAYERVRQVGIRAGLLKPIHPHALRHSYATHLLTSGADLRVLQELLGHTSLQATQKYTHLNLDELARVMETHHPLSKKFRNL